MSEPLMKAHDKAKDPVCGREFRQPEAKDYSIVQGKTYFFCSDGCKRRFDEDPAPHIRKLTHVGS